MWFVLASCYFFAIIFHPTENLFAYESKATETSKKNRKYKHTGLRFLICEKFQKAQSDIVPIKIYKMLKVIADYGLKDTF